MSNSASSPTPDASSTVKGKLKLAGSLGGTAASPTVVTNANLTGDVTSVGNATTYAGVVPVANGGTGSSTLNFNQVFNVVSYGAVGNGTTDDATAIQSAINACGTAGGGIVYFPKGTYSVHTQLTITSDGVVLMGQAMTQTTIQAGASIAGVLEISGTPVTGAGVKNLTLLSNSLTTSNTMQVSGGQYGEFENLRIYGGAGLYALLLTANSSTNTMHNRWKSIILQPNTANNSSALLVSGNFSTATANTCYEDFDDLTIAWSAATTGVTIKGIWLQACDNVRFHNVHMYGVGTPAGTNIAIVLDYSGTSAGWPADCIVETVDFGGTGVSIQNSGTPTGATLNRIENVSATNGVPANPYLANLQWNEEPMVAFEVYRSAAQSLSAGQNLITPDTVIKDLLGNYSTSTGKFTAPYKGRYNFFARAGVSGLNNNRIFTGLRVNGNEYWRGNDLASVSTGDTDIASVVGGPIDLNVGDYVQLYIYTLGATALETGQAQAYLTGYIESLA